MNPTEAGLSVPRQACLSRGGHVCPEAGLSVPRRACLSSTTEQATTEKYDQIYTTFRYLIQRNPFMSLQLYGIAYRRVYEFATSGLQGYLAHKKTSTP